MGTGVALQERGGFASVSHLRQFPSVAGVCPLEDIRWILKSGLPALLVISFEIVVQPRFHAELKCQNVQESQGRCGHRASLLQQVTSRSQDCTEVT